jgi:hypothetical protein
VHLNQQAIAVRALEERLHSAQHQRPRRSAGRLAAGARMPPQSVIMPYRPRDHGRCTGAQSPCS